MSEKKSIVQIVLIATCLMLVMRGGKQENMQSELSSLNGFRQLAENYKAKFCLEKLGGVTDKQKKRYESEKKTMKTQMPKNPIEAFLMIGGPDKGNGTTAAMAFVGFIGIWIVLFVFSILGCLCYICCCCCDSCCPPCSCCRRDYDKKPITGSEVNICLILLIVFSAPLFIIGIWGMAASTEIPASLSSLQCAMVAFPYNLLNGATTSSGGIWMGLKPLAIKLTDVSTTLEAKVNEIANSMSDTTFVKTRKDNLSTKIQAIPTNFQTRQTVRPDSALTQETNYLKLTGPFSTENTLSWRLNQYALAQTTVMGEMLVQIKSNLDKVTPNFSVYTNLLNTGVNSIKSQNNLLQDQYNNLGKMADDLIEPIKNQMMMATRNFFVLMIIFGMINVLFAVLIMVCKFKKGRYFLHYSWCCMGLSMIFMFLILVILYPVSFVMFNLCEILISILEKNTGKAYLNTLDLGVASITDKMGVCLWNGDGNIAASFGIKDQLANVNAITNNFNQFLDKLDPASPNYVDINVATANILNLEIGMAHGFTIGRIANVTIDVSSQTLANPYLAIADLNSYVDSNTTTRNGASVSNVGCGKINDYFVYSSLDCPSNRLAKTFTNSSDSATAYMNELICIPVVEMSVASLDLRYADPSGSTGFCTTCASDCASVKSKFAFIKNYDISRMGAYQGLEDAITSIKTDMKAFNDELITKVSPLTSVATSVNGFVNIMKEIIDQMNCNFLQADLQNIVNSMCVAFLPVMTNVIKLIAAGSICFYFAVFAAFMSAMKVSKSEKKAVIATNAVLIVPVQGIQMSNAGAGAQQQQGYIPVQPMVVQQQQGYPMAKY